MRAFDIPMFWQGDLFLHRITNEPIPMKNFHFPLFGAALLLTVGLAAQELVPLGNEFLVNQVIPGTQSNPSVASDDDGGYLIAWVENGSGIRTRRFGTDHQPITDEITVGIGQWCRVYHWSDGRYVIVWGNTTTTSLRVFNADNTLGEVNALAVTSDVDMDIQGDVLVTAYASGQHVHLRKWDLLTDTWIGASVQASEAPGANYQLPQVRWTSTGGIVAVYRGGSPTPHHIYRKTFNSDLLAQAPEASVYNINGSIGVINVSINSQDQLLIYVRSGVNGTDVFAGRVLDADGGVLMQSVGNTSAPYAYYYTDCELFDNGSLVLTNNYKTSLNDPLDHCVRANYGLFLGAPNTGFQIASTTSSGPQRHPAVARLPGAGFIMVWSGNGFQGDDDGVYARAFAAGDFPTALPEPDAPVRKTWPNPFQEELYVTFDRVTPVSLHDATGRTVLTMNAPSGTTALDLSHLARGAYVLRWYAMDGTPLMTRVVKQ